MDVLVLLEERPDHSPVLAHVNSIPAPLHGAEGSSRDVITLYGDATPDTLALALAAVVESHRTWDRDRGPGIRHLGIWPDKGAIGDAAWRDDAGTLVTHDLEIPLERLGAVSAQLFEECGTQIRRLVAGLSMPDWPEGARRAINISLESFTGSAATVFTPLEATLERLRAADAFAFEFDGD
jgi:hypothetical protein